MYYWNIFIKTIIYIYSVKGQIQELKLGEGLRLYMRQGAWGPPWGPQWVQGEALVGAQSPEAPEF